MYRLRKVASRSFIWFDLHELEHERGLVTLTGRLRSSAIERLSVDLLTHILAYLPDLSSLQAFVLVGPQMYNAYTTKKHEILWSVMVNEVGREGLTWARALYRAESASRIQNQNGDGCVPVPSPSEDCFKNPQEWFGFSQNTITGREAQRVAYYESVCKKLAVCFSMVYKDRTSPISRLEEREYTFFQRALFRFWTLAYIANAGNTRSREGQVRWSDLSGSEQLGFCRDLPRDEIAQLCEVHVLVYRLAKWRTGGEVIQDFPDVLLQHLDNKYPKGPGTLPEGMQLSERLEALYIERGIIHTDISTVSKGPSMGAILIGGSIHAHECHDCKSLALLWGPSNWHLFRCWGSFLTLQRYLPGRLRYSPQVIKDFHGFCNLPHYAPTMYREILTVRGRQRNKGHSSGRASGDWSEDMYLCKRCLLMFMMKRVFVWYIGRKRQEGPLKPDCWEGWDCELLESNSHEHDANFNHLRRAAPFDPYALSGTGAVVGIDMNSGYSFHGGKSFVSSIVVFVVCELIWTALGPSRPLIWEWASHFAAILVVIEMDVWRCVEKNGSG